MSNTGRHNELAPALLKQLISGTISEATAMIVLESVILGVMFYYRPNPLHAAEFLDAITERVIERMKP